jgi:hypothetical protein
MNPQGKGGFKKGVSGNPKGRKPREVERDYLTIFRSRVSPEDWGEIIDKAVSDAIRGDSVARKFIADYMIGVPVQKIDAKVDSRAEITEIIYQIASDAP